MENSKLEMQSIQMKHPTYEEFFRARKQRLENVTKIHGLPFKQKLKAEVDFRLLWQLQNQIENILRYYDELWLDGFKLLHRFEGKLYSPYIKPFDGGLIYEVGQVTEPKPGCGPICVYSVLRPAVEAIMRCETLVIYHCRYKPSELQTIWTPEIGTTQFGRLEVGSVLASKVIIGKRVSQVEIKKLEATK